MHCPGYKAWIDVAWKDQNLVVEKKVQRHQNAIDKAHREEVLQKQILKASFSKIPPILKQDLEGYAINFFLSSYVFLPEEMQSQMGYLDGVYPIWINSSPTSPLKPALIAVASFMLEAWSELRPDVSMSWSRSHYLKGLIALRQSLGKDEGASDHVLLASLLLDMYESLHAFIGVKPRESPHINGTMALIKYHRRTPFTSELSRRVLLNARNQIVQRLYEHSEAVPSDISAWTQITQDVPRTPKSELDDLFIEAANLKAQKSRTDLRNRRLASQTVRRAIQLDRRCQEWRDNLPEDWSLVQVSSSEDIPQSVRDAGFYSDSCLIYRNVFVANAFNRYCCLRIECYQTIVDSLKPHDLSSSKLWKTAQETTQEMADMVCASVPFLLGDRTNMDRMDAEHLYPHSTAWPPSPDHTKLAATYGGWFLSPCIGYLLSIRMTLRPGQREWIESQMGRLMKVYIMQPERKSLSKIEDKQRNQSSVEL